MTTFDRVDARRAFLEKLIDDAGLFPPARLSMADALAANARARAGPHAWILGKFVVPASRLGELAELRADAEELFPVSVVIDGDQAASFALVWEHERSRPGNVYIESLEMKLPSGDEAFSPMTKVERAAMKASRGVALYIELDVHSDVDEQIAEIARVARDAEGMLCAKIRCGGPAAQDAPAPASLAHAIHRIVESSSWFKATAGLHHPVRGHNAGAGFMMHGFLNVIGAAVMADDRGRLDERVLAEMIADEDPANFRLDSDRFRWKGAVADERAIRRARERTIHSFGSCSFDEPVQDLIALGILRETGL